jgi:hypothetical protein
MCDLAFELAFDFVYDLPQKVDCKVLFDLVFSEMSRQTVLMGVKILTSFDKFKQKIIFTTICKIIKFVQLYNL